MTRIADDQLVKVDAPFDRSRGSNTVLTNDGHKPESHLENLTTSRRDYSFLIITLIFLSVIVGVFQLTKDGIDLKPKTPSKILDQLPNSVRIILPDSIDDRLSPGASDPFQIEYKSEQPSVGWLGFVTDEGQTISDLVMIGSSMTTFEQGVPKTFPVIVKRPNFSFGYHMVVVVCTDAFTSASLPKFQEIETFMRISAMGGRLPRPDCKDLRFRL